MRTPLRVLEAFAFRGGSGHGENGCCWGTPHAGNLPGEGVLEFLPSRIPLSVRVHASGLSCALRLGVILLRLSPPCGLRFPSSTDPPLNALLGTWEQGPLARFAKGDPSSKREIQRNGDHHHVPPTTSILIGFLGNDAEVRTNGKNNAELHHVSPSQPRALVQEQRDRRIHLAHRMAPVALSSASSVSLQPMLKKGAHIFRSRARSATPSTTPKKTGRSRTHRDSVRVTSIRNLDRTAKATPEELEIEEVSVSDR